MTVNSAALWPNCVLLVEDSVIIAMEAESCLRELGVADVQVATCVANAMRSLDQTAFDLAILDYDLVDETSEPVAARLAAQGTAFAMASGYNDLADHFIELGANWVLAKPYSMADLRTVLNAAAQLPRL